MEMENQKTTVMEALVAEMLGDIGKLHEVVAQLKKDLPMLLDGANRSQRNEQGWQNSNWGVGTRCGTASKKYCR